MGDGQQSTTRWAAALVACALVGASCSGDDEASSTTTVPDDATTTTVDQRSGEVTVLSYNVAGLPQEVSDMEPAEHIPLISPLLEDYDIVLTQEDFDWWVPALDALDFAEYHERLRADTSHEHVTGPHPGPASVGIDPAVDRPTLLVGDGLGVLSRHPLGEVDRVAWATCHGGADTSQGGAGDCLAMKGFLVTVVTLADGVEVVLVDLHAEAGGGVADRQASSAGFAQLAAHLTAQHPDAAIVLMGDTNLHTEEGREPKVTEDGEVLPSDREVWQDFLAATSLTDACDVVDCDDPGRIDKAAFRSGGGVELAPLSLEFAVDRFVDEQGDALSDHDPLVVRWSWQRTG